MGVSVRTYIGVGEEVSVVYVLCAWCVHSYLCVSLVHNNMCVSKSDTAHLMYTHVNHLLYPSHGLPVGVCLLDALTHTW